MVGRWQQIFTVSIVTYRPVAGQRPRNKHETTAVAMKQRSKHASTTIVTVGKGVMQPVANQMQHLDYSNSNGVFSMSSVPRSYFEDSRGDPVSC
jgi:hypothetical protein